MKKILRFLIYIVIMMQFIGCWDDSFSTDPNHRLSFQTDTLRFDTLFANVPTPTKWMVVHNRNPKALLIEHISLRDGNKGFRLNVDGISGETHSQFSNIEIAANDSIFILFEVTASPTGMNTPQEVVDKLDFTVNGNTQELVLSMDVWDADLWRGKIIDEDFVLTAGSRPIVVYDSLHIKTGARLSINEGCRLFFHKGAFILVDGTIIANGTSQQPITFEGDRLDNLLVNLPYRRMPGQWVGFRFREESYDNHFTHCIIRATDYAMILDSSEVNRQKITLENCLLQNSTYNVFSAIHCKTTSMGCEFSNGGALSVYLQGGDHSFLHSTIVNYAPWGSSGSQALMLTNYTINNEGTESQYPLIGAYFENSIIGGKSSNELYIAQESTLTEPFSILFRRNIIKSKGQSNDHQFEDIQWWNNSTNNPKFANTGSSSDYHFDFRLTKESEAIGKGVTNFINNTTDFYGNSRLINANADLGAYQFIDTQN